MRSGIWLPLNLWVHLLKSFRAGGGRNQPAAVVMQPSCHNCSSRFDRGKVFEFLNGHRERTVKTWGLAAHSKEPVTAGGRVTILGQALLSESEESFKHATAESLTRIERDFHNFPFDSVVS